MVKAVVGRAWTSFAVVVVACLALAPAANAAFGLPDIPISSFTLRFKKNGLVLMTANLCRPPALALPQPHWAGTAPSRAAGSPPQLAAAPAESEPACRWVRGCR